MKTKIKNILLIFGSLILLVLLMLNYKLVWRKFLDFSGYREFSLTMPIIYLCLGFVLLIFERYMLGWDKCSLKRLVELKDRSVKFDVIGYIVEITFITRFLTILFSFGLLYKLAAILRERFSLDLIVDIEPKWFKIIIAFLIIDFFKYFRHFLLHKIPWLWEFHKFHHSASTFNMITFTRGHFMEFAFVDFMANIVIVILGFTNVNSYIGILCFNYILSMLKHSNFNWNWGFIGRYILVSPDYHKIHHALQAKYYDKNMGNVLVVWDMIFGTYVNPGVNIKNLGIKEDIHKRNFINAQLDSYKTSYQTLKNILKKTIK